MWDASIRSAYKDSFPEKEKWSKMSKTFANVAKNLIRIGFVHWSSLLFHKVVVNKFLRGHVHQRQGGGKAGWKPRLQGLTLVNLGETPLALVMGNTLGRSLRNPQEGKEDRGCRVDSLPARREHPTSNCSGTRVSRQAVHDFSLLQLGCCIEGREYTGQSCWFLRPKIEVDHEEIKEHRA